MPIHSPTVYFHFVVVSHTPPSKSALWRWLGFHIDFDCQNLLLLLSSLLGGQSSRFVCFVGFCSIFSALTIYDFNCKSATATIVNANGVPVIDVSELEHGGESSNESTATTEPRGGESHESDPLALGEESPHFITVTGKFGPLIISYAFAFVCADGKSCPTCFPCCQLQIFFC